MKRILSLLFVLIALILGVSLFTACGEEGNNEVNETPCVVELILEPNARDTGYKVMGIACECDSVVIPETYNEKPVSEIATYAFLGNQTIKEITIPKGVTKIGQSSFENCAKLEKVIFQEESTLKTINKNAFKGCVLLKEIDLPDSITAIQYGAFMNCESLVKITLPKNVKTITQFAFAYNYSLEEVILPSSLKAIEFYAFCDSTKLERIIFLGTSEAFQKVVLDEFWNMNVPATEIVCQTIVPII